MKIILNKKMNVYEQIVSEYKRYISLNILRYDEKLPSCRALATELGVNPNTVQRAYNVLEEEGFIRTIPELKFSNSSPEDLDTTGEDHIADEVRYMCMARPISPVIKKKNEVYGDDPLNLREHKRYRKYSY